MMAEVKKAGSDRVQAETRTEICAFQRRQDLACTSPRVDQVTDLRSRQESRRFRKLPRARLRRQRTGSGESFRRDLRRARKRCNGVATAKLQLVPKSEKVRNTYSEIFLWIDLDKGISVQQQFFQPQGDYRLAKYSRCAGEREEDSGRRFQAKDHEQNADDFTSRLSH